MSNALSQLTPSPPWSLRRLLAAWERLRKQHPHCEFDQTEWQEFSTNPESQCELIRRHIEFGSYRPLPYRAMNLKKGDGGTRLLLVPALADRIAQAAVATWLTDLCDPEMSDHSYAYRPGRSVRQACAQVQSHLSEGCGWVIHADILSFFDEVDHHNLFETLRDQPWWGNRLEALVRRWIRPEIEHFEVAGIDGPVCLCRGLPQGSPLSPVLSNLFLSAIDRMLEEQGIKFVRYADDLLVLEQTHDEARSSLFVLEDGLAKSGLALNLAKTFICKANDGFIFLGQSFPNASLTESSIGHLPHDGPKRYGEGISDRPLPDGAEAAVREITNKPVEADAKTTEDPLLRTLYLIEPQVRLNREGDALVVERDSGEPLRVPAARLHQIMAFSHVNFTSGAISLCLEKSIPVMLLSGRGRHFGVIDPLRLNNVQLQQSQFEMRSDADRSLVLARAWIAGKVANSRLLLRRLNRRHPIPDIDAHQDTLQRAHRHALNAESPDSLRGHEGAAAAAYYMALAKCLPADWGFTGRKRRPPTDPVNALLSYGYTVLYYNILTLVLARGLHPQAGFFHVQRGGHHALVSDLMEEFRALVVDAVVVDLVLNGRLVPGHFSWPEQPGEPCLMSDTACRTLIHALEKKLNSVQQPSGMSHALDWRRIMDMQVLQLVAVLHGRASTYVPFTPK